MNSEVITSSDWVTRNNQWKCILEKTSFFNLSNRELQENLLKTTQIIMNNDVKNSTIQLRKPRLLYGCNESIYTPRWPHGSEVVEELSLLEDIHDNVEHFYNDVDKDVKIPLSKSLDTKSNLVYDYIPNVGKYFTKSFVGGKAMIEYFQTNKKLNLKIMQSQHILEFESRFESGNLSKAYHIKENEYELWLQKDLFTNRHTQWYFFKIKKCKIGCTYRITIQNFTKVNSLYNFGMKPLFYSEMNAKYKNIAWTRRGNNIKYYKNNIKYIFKLPCNSGEFIDLPFKCRDIFRYTRSNENVNYYSLTFTFSVDYKDDVVYFAHCYPYTYTRLQKYLKKVFNNKEIYKICQQRVLCQTLAGNLVHVLTITSSDRDSYSIDSSKRKAIVLSARVHPGETNSSWIIEGFLDFILSNTEEAKILRGLFVFKIIPMLNPDGVIVGNYRCSLSGRDLNRQYRTILKDIYAPIWHSRIMTKKLIRERTVMLYCDIHGHSRKQNYFLYGCSTGEDPKRRLSQRIFPMILVSSSPNMGNYDSCRYKLQKSKEGTGRITFWRMGILNSYTLEASFCGSTIGDKKNTHFSQFDYMRIGKDFGDAILDYCDPNPAKIKTKKPKKLKSIKIRNAFYKNLKKSYMNQDLERDKKLTKNNERKKYILNKKKNKMNENVEYNKIINKEELIPTDVRSTSVSVKYRYSYNNNQTNSNVLQYSQLEPCTPRKFKPNPNKNGFETEVINRPTIYSNQHNKPEVNKNCHLILNFNINQIKPKKLLVRQPNDTPTVKPLLFNNESQNDEQNNFTPMNKNEKYLQSNSCITLTIEKNSKQNDKHSKVIELVLNGILKNTDNFKVRKKTSLTSNDSNKDKKKLVNAGNLCSRVNINDEFPIQFTDNKTSQPVRQNSILDPKNLNKSRGIKRNIIIHVIYIFTSIKREYSYTHGKGWVDKVLN
ncbi:ATP/GTP-binding protein-like 2 [Intoshia linei]|uniref:ATP/GTP-binding protein-like 2 n=1 Tax=Intoshia linei TaxID=1819745 RepID=A0A177B4W6_9BILA|nr:ATP/GTP-binding protein-like 2 [Intoshia linei]